MSGPLDQIRVVELGTMVSAPYCGKLLADFGADVIKVEPKGGDEARTRGPFPNNPPEGADKAELSALYLYLNTNKRSVELDLEMGSDRSQLAALIASADLLIDNHSLSWLEQQGLSWPQLQEIHPSLVFASITPYGRTGPRAEAPGDELTLTHGGGLGFLLPTRSRDTQRAPVKLGGYQVGYHGGLVAALAAAGTLYGSRSEPSAHRRLPSRGGALVGVADGDRNSLPRFDLQPRTRSAPSHGAARNARRIRGAQRVRRSSLRHPARADGEPAVVRR